LPNLAKPPSPTTTAISAPEKCKAFARELDWKIWGENYEAHPQQKFMKILFTRYQTVRINLLANLFENVP